jgi:hypothetical protein
MRRRLTKDEIAYAEVIFGDAIDYDAVRITRGSVFATFSATTTGNRINLQPAHFLGDTLDLTEVGMLVLIHELAHVWQYQQSGPGYIVSSLASQLWAWATTGSRHGAYDWRKALHKPWPRWNAEQQAQCISDYNSALRSMIAGKASPMDAETLAMMNSRHPSASWGPLKRCRAEMHQGMPAFAGMTEEGSAFVPPPLPSGEGNAKRS